jgi:hypothetical protein
MTKKIVIHATNARDQIDNNQLSLSQAGRLSRRRESRAEPDPGHSDEGKGAGSDPSLGFCGEDGSFDRSARARIGAREKNSGAICREITVRSCGKRL